MSGTKRSKIKKNDQVVVIAGRDKGRRGRVLEVVPGKGKIKVEGIGMIGKWGMKKLCYSGNYGGSDETVYGKQRGVVTGFFSAVSVA